VRERATAVSTILALAALVAGVDVAVHTSFARGFAWDDVLGLALAGLLVVLAPLLPAAALAAWRPRAGVVAAVALAVAVVLATGAQPPLVLAVTVAGLACLAWPRLGPGLTATVAVALVLGAAGGVERRGAPSRREGPNVLLVTLDTVRYDHTSVGGDQRHPTPRHAARAATGTSFDQAIATAPLTGPSHASLLTGRYPSRLGLFANGVPLPDSPGSLARVLRAAGWHTGAVVSALPLSRDLGYARGFDTYDDATSHLPGFDDLTGARLATRLGLRVPSVERQGSRTVERAVKWLRARDTRGPFFLWVHLYDAHGPYHPPREAKDRFAPGPPPTDGPRLPLPRFWGPHERRITDAAWLDGMYTGEIAATDAQLGRVLDAVAADDRPAVVAVVGDHGESVGEGGVWFDHGQDLRDAVLRVPLVLAGPGVPAGQRVTCQISTVGLAATILRLAGVADPHPREGRDLLDGGCDHDAFASYGLPGVEQFFAVRREGHKVVDQQGLRGFDLVADPREEHAISPDPEAVAALAAFAGQAAPAAPIALEGLRALGYVAPER
jgi:arylsulfatase A-like enzyme